MRELQKRRKEEYLERGWIPREDAHGKIQTEEEVREELYGPFPKDPFEKKDWEYWDDYLGGPPYPPDYASGEDG